MGGEIQSMRVDVHMRWIGRRLILSLMDRTSLNKKGTTCDSGFSSRFLGLIVDEYFRFDRRNWSFFWSFSLSIYIYIYLNIYLTNGNDLLVSDSNGTPNKCTRPCTDRPILRTSFWNPKSCQH